MKYLVYLAAGLALLGCNVDQKVVGGADGGACIQPGQSGCDPQQNTNKVG